MNTEKEKSEYKKGTGWFMFFTTFICVISAAAVGFAWKSIDAAIIVLLADAIAMLAAIRFNQNS